MRVRSRHLPLSILVLSLVISIFLLAPRSEAINSPQDPPTPSAGEEAGGPVVRSDRFVRDQTGRTQTLRTCDHKRRENGRRHLQSSHDKGKGLLRDSQKRTRQRVSLGEPDCKNDTGRWLRWSGGRQSSGEVGAQGQSHLAAECFVRRYRRSETSGGSRGPGCKQRHDHHGRSTSRRSVKMIPRLSMSLDSSRLRSPSLVLAHVYVLVASTLAVFYREDQVVPDKHRSGSFANLHFAARHDSGSRRRPQPAPNPFARECAPEQTRPSSCTTAW